MKILLLKYAEICREARTQIDPWRMVVVLMMGFASGLPLVLVGATLQAWYTKSGVDIMTIGVLTLVGLPYTLKFLWAPLLDRFHLPWLGRRRGWIIGTQLALVLGFLVMASMNPAEKPGLLALVAMVVAIFSATQDVAIDAYRTEILTPDERGIGTSLFTSGYRVAMWASGGLALILADQLGWRATYSLMAILMGVSVIITFLAQKTPGDALQPESLQDAIIMPFKALFARPKILFILVFIVVYKLGDAFALSLGTPFLIRGLGFSLTDVGAIYKTLGIIGSITGAIFGGLLMIRLRLFSALWYFGILQALSNFMFMSLAIVGKSYPLMMATIFTENFCGGMATVAFIALLMALCDKRYTATQYALLSALSSIGRVFIGPAAGFVAAHMGWVQFYLVSVLVSIPGLLMLWLIRAQIQGRLAFSSDV